VATALLAVREVIVSMGAHIAGPALNIVSALAGSVEQVALGVSVGNAHRVASALLAANHLVDNETGISIIGKIIEMYYKIIIKSFFIKLSHLMI